MESYGKFKQVDPGSAADARAQEILETTTFHNGQRYDVGMLWADDNVQFPNNYFSSLVQLKSLEKRLSRDTSLKENYANTIREDLEKGYFITVPDAHKVKQRSDKEWYLPHHLVINPNKPVKVRRVLNGAAKFHGTSLNKSLLTGPDLLQNLIYYLGSVNINSPCPQISRVCSSKWVSLTVTSHHCVFCGGRTPQQML